MLRKQTNRKDLGNWVLAEKAYRLRGWPSEEELPQEKHMLIRKTKFQTQPLGVHQPRNFWGKSEMSLAEPERLGPKPSLLRKWGQGDTWASSSNPDSFTFGNSLTSPKYSCPLIDHTSPFLLPYFSVMSIAYFGSQQPEENAGTVQWLGRTLDFDVSLLLVMDWMLPSWPYCLPEPAVTYLERASEQRFN